MSTPENTAAVLGTSWPEVFRALTLGEDLSDDVAAWAMGEMMAGDATEGQVGGFLLAL
ncbi:anthranilate phosphoribosyltransferase, partial [Xanthomonas citri pv. citri]|nr:anthranilate phosphoribosyltransferase [Xanthomonas citri pv. citri]